MSACFNVTHIYKCPHTCLVQERATIKGEEQNLFLNKVRYVQLLKLMESNTRAYIVYYITVHDLFYALGKKTNVPNIETVPTKVFQLLIYTGKKELGTLNSGVFISPMI